MAKKLLNERTVRRFQRLANLSPINEMYNKRDEEMDEAMHGKRDEEMEEGMYKKRDDDMDEAMYKRDEEEVMKEQEDDMDMGDKDMDMDDKGMDMDGDLELTDEEAQAIIDLGTKLEQAMGGLDDMDMDDKDMDMDDKGMDMDKGPDMGDEDLMGEEDLMEALAGINYVPSQGEIVNEVAQRVARRLKQAKLHEAKLNRALGKRR
tara:strand:- start:146 stop:760 length:615 start_codon:yes stop_codon:yes gene_type:complete